MASMEKTEPAENNETGATAYIPNSSVRRSKRLQDQSLKSKENGSKAKQGSMIAKKLPPGMPKKDHRPRKTKNSAKKQVSQPNKRTTKSKVLIDDPETHSDGKKPNKGDGKNNATSIKAKASPMPTLNQQAFEPRADKVERKPASRTGRSRHSPNEAMAGQGGDHPPSPKRKLDHSKAQDGSNTEPLVKSPRLSINSLDRSGNLRAFGRLQHFGAAGPQITQCKSKGMYCTDTVDISRLPSPLANLGYERERILHFIDSHVPDQVRLLFHEIRNDSPNHSNRITRALASKAQGVFVEFLSGIRPAPEGNSDQTKVNEDDVKISTAIHCWPGNAPKVEFALGTHREAGALLRGRKLEAYVSIDPETGQSGQYVVNDYDQLIINESVCGHDLMVGPLPEFAILQFAGHTLFWWSSLRSLSHAPHRDALGLIQDMGTNMRFSLLEDDWGRILDEGLARHRMHAQRSAQLKGRKKPYQIDRYWNLDIDCVLLGIASIWDALRKKQIIYAFAGVDVFDPDVVRSGQLKGSGVVGGARKFIMPLSLPPNEAAQAAALDHWNRHKANTKHSKTRAAEPAVGHIVLAVAERNSEEENNTSVSITIFDSSTDTVPQGKIAFKAATLAVRSDWLGDRRSEFSTKSLPQWPKDKLPGVHRQPGFQQPMGSNSCGLFTILNAWAVMLEIPLSNNVRRRGRRTDRELLIIGQELVNLALAGCMDSRTIQAYLNVFGLSERQDAANREDDIKVQVDAVRMDNAKFLNELNVQEYRDAGIPGPSLSPEVEEAREDGNPLPEAHVRSVMIAGGAGTTREQALRALRGANGDVEDAAAIIQAEKQDRKPPSTVPENESPK